MRTLFIAIAASFALAAPASAACDLLPIIGAPATARVGANVRTTLEIQNRGDTRCVGTNEASTGYMVDIFLSSDRTEPSTWAVYNATWREDVLLRSGRVSRTESVAPGGSYRYGAATGYEIGPFTLPTGIPPGDYFLCAGADMGRRIAESNERNNAACNPIRIIAPPRPPIDPRRAPAPLPQPVPPQQP
jgi:hypothetical protein